MTDPFHKGDRVRLTAEALARQTKQRRKRPNAATVVNEPRANNIGIVWYGNKITSIEYWDHSSFELIPPEDQGDAITAGDFAT